MAKSHATAPVEALDDTALIDDRARNVLVHLTGSEIDHRLIREAGMYVTGTGGKLVLVNIMTPKEFTERQQAYAQIPHLPTYTVCQAEESCRRHIFEIGRRALESLGIDYIVVGTVGRETGRLLTTARQYDCGHLFLGDQPQSLLRRLVARSLCQAVTRKFDGLVTVLRSNSEEKISNKRRWTIRE
jgi:nucleotide-binding universal stress UspA family protein